MTFSTFLRFACMVCINGLAAARSVYMEFNRHFKREIHF